MFDYLMGRAKWEFIMQVLMMITITYVYYNNTFQTDTADR